MPAVRIERMNRSLKTASIALALLAMLPAAAQAAPSSTVKNLGETPGYLATDGQGNAWVIIGGVNETVARVKPSGNVKKFDVPELNQAGDGALGHDGDMWFTVQNGVVEFDPGDPVGSATEHTINSISDARGITKGPAGRMYAASGDQLVSFKPADPANFKDETVNGMGARDIVASGGDIFAADFAGGRIIRATKNLEVKKRYHVEGGPQEMAAGAQRCGRRSETPGPSRRPSGASTGPARRRPRTCRTRIPSGWRSCPTGGSGSQSSRATGWARSRPAVRSSTSTA